MCELAVFVQDNVPSTHPLFNLNYQAGDICAAHDDGWAWTDAELKNPRWRIVKIPGIAVSTYLDILASRRDVLGRMTIRRDRSIDVSSIAFVGSVPAGSTIMLDAASRALFNAARTTKSTIP